MLSSSLTGSIPSIWRHAIGRGLFEQVKLGLHGPFRWLFSAEAPHSNEIKLDGNPWDVINRCKVERTNPQFVTDVINDFLTWLARWVQRVIPDRAMMADAIDMARGQLLREARKARWSWPQTPVS